MRKNTSYRNLNKNLYSFFVLFGCRSYFEFFWVILKFDYKNGYYRIMLPINFITNGSINSKFENSLTYTIISLNIEKTNFHTKLPMKFF